VNAEAVREAKNFSGMEIRLDVLLVDRSLGLIRGEHLNPVGTLGSLAGSNYHHAIGAGLLGARTRGIETDDDLATAVPQILRLGMTLAAVAEDGDGFALQGIGVGVVLVKDGGHGKCSSRLRNRPVGRSNNGSEGVRQCQVRSWMEVS
jgi:hypothetical protein